ncbi:putative short chain dehydrogenase [Dendryphion nanum]|uniref:Short chain dehydrogenase n=1 Tax=Dendryphion nanum TaxID=256645 RepID=A0A9P9IRI5_9PLEO|nr:putative short chain dehydrogenase [Dendryphion nanum]
MNDKKIVLVTGANTGLGYQIVRALCASEIAYEVLVGGRSLSKAEQALTDLKEEFPDTQTQIRAIQVDIEDDDSIASAFEYVQKEYGRLDALVNNAGTCYFGAMTMREVWNQTYNVNVTGTNIMTSTFAPLLIKSNDPRLMFIASGTSSLTGTHNLDMVFNRPPAKGWPKTRIGVFLPAYRSSKTGMNMMMREWYRILKEDGVKVWGISPGYLATGLGGSQEVNKQQGAIDPAIGGEVVAAALEGKRDSDVGKIILRQGVQPW